MQSPQKSDTLFGGFFMLVKIKPESANFKSEKIPAIR